MKQIRLLILIATTALFFNGCIDLPDELVMPEWDINLTIPLINKYLTLDDFVEDQANLSIDPVDNLYLLKTKKYTQTRSPLDFVQINQAVGLNNILLPPINDSSDIYLDFRSNIVEMDSAVFATGSVNFSFTNNSAADVTFTIVIPGISINGEVLSIQIPLLPGESRIVTRNLAGYKYAQPPHQPDMVKDQFWIKLKSISNGNISSGLVNFDMQISEFRFSSVTASFTEQDLGRKTDVYEADLGEDIEDFRNKIKLSSATLSITARYVNRYANPFDIRVDSLNVIAWSKGSEIYLTDSTGSSNISFLITDGMIAINFNEKNSNIVDIINSVPDFFEIGASFRILGNNQSGTLSDEDLIIVGVELNTISRLAIERSTIYDTVAINIATSEREEIRNAKTGSVTAEILNSIPLNAWLKVEFYDSLFNKIFTLRVDNKDSVSLVGAFINQLTGEVTSPAVSVKSIDLTEQEIISLSRTYYVSTSISIETTGFNQNNPPLVKIRATDRMKVNINSKIKYRVNGL